MQFCLYNKTSSSIYVEEIGMTVGAKQKSRVLTEYEYRSIKNSYPGLTFVNALLESKPKASRSFVSEAKVTKKKTKRGK